MDMKFRTVSERTRILLVALIMGVSLMGATSSIEVQPFVPAFTGISGNLFKFRNETELVMFLKDQPSKYQGGGDFVGDIVRMTGRGFSPLGVVVELTASTANSKAAASVTSADTAYSTTNVQVSGVDEADIIKTDGKFIYYVRENSVFIVKATPASEAKLLTTLDTEGYIHEIFIAENRLAVIQRAPVTSKSVTPQGGYFRPVQGTSVKVYDTSAMENPKLVKEVKLDGYYQTSRLIGDYMYLTAQQRAQVIEGATWLPSYKDGSTTRTVPASDIYYIDEPEPYYGYTMIMGLNVVRADEEAKVETFLLGPGSVQYVSSTGIYIASTARDQTTIYKLGMKYGLVFMVASGKVPGRPLNQFSMDEYDGYFRIATTSRKTSTGTATTSNNVYVLDANMQVVGRLEDLAPGESIYSARFMGKRCYLVTFKKVDPLFTIDLSNPKTPTVLGKLKIPGYSDYLHPYDENHLIGLGKETVEAKQGDFAWYQGIKISLFDVTDVANPKELAKLEVGDRGTDSPALQNHKAFVFSLDRNLLILPILEAEVPEQYTGTPNASAYGRYVYQGAYVFHLGLDGITLKGRVTHLAEGELLKSGYYISETNIVQRSLYIGNTLYTVSDSMIKASKLSDLSLIATVKLP